MKHKIAIFGDSYGDMYTHQHNGDMWAFKKLTTPNINLNNLSWPMILMLQKNYDVCNFAKAGTSVFYSYDKFEKNYEEYDTIIFLVTEASRLYIENENIFAPNNTTIGRIIKNSEPNHIFMNEYLAISQYYKYLQSDKLHNFVRDSVVEKVESICKQKNKKLIMIPAIGNDPETTKIAKYFDICLNDISNKELMTQFGDMKYRTEKETRPCHMSENNNMILANLLTKIIEGEELKITLDDFEFKKVSNPKHYWWQV